MTVEIRFARFARCGAPALVIAASQALPGSRAFAESVLMMPNGTPEKLLSWRRIETEGFIIDAEAAAVADAELIRIARRQVESDLAARLRPEHESGFVMFEAMDASELSDWRALGHFPDMSRLNAVVGCEALKAALAGLVDVPNVGISEPKKLP